MTTKKPISNESDPIDPIDRFKRGCQVLLLFLFSTVVGLLVAEALVRIALPESGRDIQVGDVIESERGKFSRYDSELGWAGLENAEDKFLWTDVNHYVSQNRYGFRGKEYPYERTDKKRILVFGDSFTWGFGVNNEDIFTSVLEEKHNDFEIINLGVSGYGNDQAYLLWLKQGKNWTPDRVVLMVTSITDFWDNAEPLRYGYPKPYFVVAENGELQVQNVPVPELETQWKGPDQKFETEQSLWLEQLSSHSKLFNIAKSFAVSNRFLREFLENNSAIFQRIPEHPVIYPLYLKKPGEEEVVRWKLMFKIIENFNKAVKNAGASMTVVLVPSSIQVYPELWETFARHVTVDRGTIDPYIPNNRLIKWCEDNGIDVVDLLPGMKAVGETNPYLYFPVNQHWTRDGNRVVAEILSQTLFDKR